MIKTLIDLGTSIYSHSDEILKGLGGLYLFLLVVVHITPTKKDDELLGKAYDFAHKFAGVLKVKK